MRPRNPACRRGFTLVETMTVVVIIGILATLATYGLRRYVYAAKSAEARQMILSIKAGEEAYREETYQYLPTADSLTVSTLHPHACLSIQPGKLKVAWEQAESCTSAQAMRAMGVTSTSPVQYGYAVGVPATGGAMPALPLKTAFDWGDHKTVNGPAFAVIAMGDVNGDGTFSVYVSSSYTDEIHTEDE